MGIHWLEIGRFSLEAGNTPVLQLAPIAVSATIKAALNTSTNYWELDPEFWFEPSFIALPEEWLAKPLVSRFYATKPQITLSCTLPPIQMRLGREAVMALWRLLAVLPEGDTGFQFPTEVSQGIIWELHLCTETVSVSFGLDAVMPSLDSVGVRKELAQSTINDVSLQDAKNDKPLCSFNEQQPSLNEQQPSLNEQQPPLNEQQPSLNEQQPPLNEQQPALNEQQPSLNEQQPSLNEQQPPLSHPFTYPTSLSQDDFCLLSLSPLHFTLTAGMGLVDILTSFSSASLESRFIGLAAPLLQESLTGYNETVETDSWKAALHRYNSLPSRVTRLISIEGFSVVHVVCHPHVLPTGTLPWGSPSPCRSLTLGSFVGMDITTETLAIELDDVAIADLCDFLLVLGDLFPRESSAVMWDECEVQSSVLIQLSVQRAFIDVSFQQQELQSLVLPNVSFECGFPRHFYENTYLPGSFECGLTTAGIYWIDQTTEYTTNLVYPLSRIDT